MVVLCQRPELDAHLPSFLVAFLLSSRSFEGRDFGACLCEKSCGSAGMLCSLCLSKVALSHFICDSKLLQGSPRIAPSTWHWTHSPVILLSKCDHGFWHAIKLHLEGKEWVSNFHRCQKKQGWALICEGGASGAHRC